MLEKSLKNLLAEIKPSDLETDLDGRVVIKNADLSRVLRERMAKSAIEPMLHNTPCDANGSQCFCPQ